MTRPPATRRLDREIFALALPALATLITEPLLVVADSAIVGHLGTTELAGLSLASNVMGVLLGLSVFLAYGTTAAVARRLGAGDRRRAIEGGIDGMVLGLIVAAGIALLVSVFGRTVLGWYDAPVDVQDAAWSYLRITAFAFPGLLVNLAATGVLRGLQNTRTPLVVAIAVNLINIALTLTFVYVVGLGLPGAAFGTTIAATGGGITLATVLLRGAVRERASIALRPRGVAEAARSSSWLILRALALQINITITTATAATTGAIGLAAHQVANTLWNAMAFVLDAFAIAAQALIGHRLGAGDADGARAVTRRVMLWGAGSAVLVGALLILVRQPIAGFFTPDTEVQRLLMSVLVVLALVIPIGGVVFVLDGVLIGAGDAKYLGLVGLIVTAVYAPAAWVVWHYELGLTWLWVAYGISILARMITLVVRQRGTAWMRLGD
ncbi:MATE family efflux transporter [Enemella sp. A6]|uniref:MATE family efflux transporter n=1 Tax=Enemella sp. A6 TaxID=3440152 RepID=UPI003EBEB4B9